MGMKERLDDRIKRKDLEILELQTKIREAQAYIQALQEASRLLPKDEAKNGKAEATLRPGGSAHKAFLILQESGKPMHITEIMKAIGLAPNKVNRISVGGTLARYARHGQIFTRTGPNTFGLIELGASPDSFDDEREPPEDFGIPEEGDEDKG
jgi:hypothetical protein